MNECNISEKPWMKSLEDFVNHVRGNKYRLDNLYERLEWANHQLFSIPGPNYERIGTPSNVQPDRMIIILDRIFTLEKKIKEVEESEKILLAFEDKLTEKELKVFHLHYFKFYSQGKIAMDMGVTQQRVYQYIDKLNQKWTKFKN